ncbi:MAG: N-acetyl sugar amidotransferase [Candidatus Hermodarchaeota archaeon]
MNFSKYKVDANLNSEDVYYGLPKEIKFCKKCVISNQRPNSTLEYLHNIESKKETIHFDNEGICDACRVSERKDTEIDWDKREKELINLCDKYRRDDGYYDCIIPGSGGKDSVKASWILKYKYGMHPLTITWAPHLYTDVGWSNFQKWVHLGFDNILFHPNGRVHRLLTRLAFDNLLHPFQPFILGQKNIGARFAALYNIPLVFYGENEAEYGNPMEDVMSPLRAAKYASGSDYGNMYLGGVNVLKILKKFDLEIVDLYPYLPIDPELYKKKQIKVHYLGYYIKWDPQESYYFAVEKSGFKANCERTEGTYSKYNSIDDKTDPYHYYTTYIKFGIGRASYDASQEIRNHKITREEGIALVKKYDHELPTKYLAEFLEYMDMTKEHFFKTIDKFRSPHIWKRENGHWKLRKAVYDEH